MSALKKGMVYEEPNYDLAAGFLACAWGGPEMG